MTQEEYIVQRLIQLEQENFELKEQIQSLKDRNNIIFRLEDAITSEATFIVELKNGEIDIKKVEK